MTTIVFLCLITEVNVNNMNNMNNMKNVKNTINTMRNSSMEFGLFGSIDFGCSSTRYQCYQHK